MHCTSKNGYGPTGRLKNPRRYLHCPHLKPTAFSDVVATPEPPEFRAKFNSRRRDYCSWSAKNSLAISLCRKKFLKRGTHHVKLAALIGTEFSLFNIHAFKSDILS